MKNLRTCLTCNAKDDKKNLFRYIINDGLLMVDYFQKLQVRGIYTCKRESCIKNLTIKSVKRSLKDENLLKIDKEKILITIKNNLIKDIFSKIHIANKGGFVTATTNKIMESLKAGKVFTFFFIANDISDNSKERVLKFLRDPYQFSSFFSKSELGSIFGKSETNILGLFESAITDYIKDQVKIYSNIYTEGVVSNGNRKNN